MDADERRLPTDMITERIIGAAYTVSNTLGVGYLEKVYENALCHELRKARLEVGQQVPLVVQYDGLVVGEFFVDLLVEDRIIVELKHVKALNDAHLAQCLSYLKTTGKTLALLINFGNPRVEVKRVALNH